MILTRPGASTPEELLDKAAVKELIEFERFCRDNSLWDEMEKCFAEDSLVRVSWYEGSGRGFVEASSRRAAPHAPHKIHNTEIWLKGDKAVAILLADIQVRMELEGIPVLLSSDTKLLFRVQKRNGLWYITAFDAIYEQDNMTTVYPGKQPDVLPGDFAGFRQSYAGMSYMLQRNGMPVNNELPGIDRPDLVEKLYREADEWLCG